MKKVKRNDNDIVVENSTSSMIRDDVLAILNRTLIGLLNIKDIKECCGTSKNFLNMNIYKNNARTHTQGLISAMQQQRQQQQQHQQDHRALEFSLLEKIIYRKIVLPSHLHVLIFCSAAKNVAIHTPTSSYHYKESDPFSHLRTSGIWKVMDDIIETAYHQGKCFSQDEVEFLAELALNKYVSDYHDGDGINNNKYDKKCKWIQYITKLLENEILSKNKVKSLCKVALNNLATESHKFKVFKCLVDVISEDELESLVKAQLQKMKDQDIIADMIVFLKKKLSKEKFKSLALLALKKLSDLDYGIRSKKIECLVDVISEDELESVAESFLKKVINNECIANVIRLLEDKISKEKYIFFGKVALNKMAHHNHEALNKMIHDNHEALNKMTDDYGKYFQKSFNQEKLNKMTDDNKFFYKVIGCVADTIIPLESLTEGELLSSIKKMTNNYTIICMIELLKNNETLTYNFKSFGDLSLNKISNDDNNIYDEMMKCLADTTSEDTLAYLAEIVARKITNNDRMRSMMKFFLKEKIISEDKCKSLGGLVLNKLCNDNNIYKLISDMILLLKNKILSEDKVQSIGELLLKKTLKTADDKYIYEMIECLSDQVSEADLEKLAEKACLSMTDDECIIKMIEFLLIYKITSEDKVKSLMEVALNKMTGVDNKLIFEMIQRLAKKTSEDELESLAEVVIKKMKVTDRFFITDMIEFLKKKLSKEKFKSLALLALNTNSVDHDYSIYKTIQCLVDVISEEELESLSKVQLQKMTKDNWIADMIKFLKSKMPEDNFKSLCELGLNKMNNNHDDYSINHDDHTINHDHSIYQVITYMADILSKDELESLAEVQLKLMTDHDAISSMIYLLKDAKISENKFKAFGELGLNKMNNHHDDSNSSREKDYSIYHVITYMVDILSKDELESLAEVQFKLMTDHSAISCMMKFLKEKISKNKFKAFGELGLNKIIYDDEDDNKVHLMNLRDTLRATDIDREDECLACGMEKTVYEYCVRCRHYSTIEIIECLADIITEDELVEFAEREIKKMTNDECIMDLMKFLKRKILSNYDLAFLSELAFENITNDCYRIYQELEYFLYSNIDEDELKQLSVEALNKMTHPYWIYRMLDFLNDEYMLQMQMESLLEIALNKKILKSSKSDFNCYNFNYYAEIKGLYYKGRKFCKQRLLTDFFNVTTTSPLQQQN